MNLNQLAKEITKREGGKKNLSIAQIKEVLRCLIDIAREFADSGKVLNLTEVKNVSLRRQNRARKSRSK